MPPPTLHDRILARFDDQELRLLCFEHFPEVGREFTTGMRLSHMVMLLLEACAHAGRGEVLLDSLEAARPSLVGNNRPALLTELDRLRTTPPSVLALKVINANVTQNVGTMTGGKVVGVELNVYLSPLPVNYSALVQPLIDHYAVVFGGRDAELAQLDAFLADPAYPFGLLVAPTGLGKTALLVHWIAQVQHHHALWRVIFAPISIRFQTASDQVVLGLLAHSLAELHAELEQFRNYDQSPNSLRALITDYLSRPLPKGTRLLLVLDGVDEATGWAVGPLCAAPPQGGLKIIISARQHTNATRDDWQQRLGWAPAPVMHLDLQALERPAIAALLRQSGPMLADHADNPASVEQFYRVSEGDPLTSNLLIKALNAGSVTLDKLTKRPPGMDAFLKDWIEQLRKRRQASRPIRELLALCAVAYGPLSSDDLQALAPDVFDLQTDIVDAVHDDEVSRFIITVGKGQHAYVFSHQRLREVFLEQIYPPKDRERLQQRLIAYGDAWYAERTQPLPDYLRQFWIAHLKAARRWDRLRAVLTDIALVGDGTHHVQPWQAARYAAEGSDTGYLTDLNLLWGWADEQRDLGLALRCALIAASLRGRNRNLTPELLVQLVTVGTLERRWSAAAALETIASMPDAQKQTACLGALLTADLRLPLQRALEIADAITDERSRAGALRALAPYLPAALLQEALAAARAIADKEDRADVLTALAPHLPPTEQAAVCAEALAAACAIPDEEGRAAVLTALAPNLPPALLQEALAAACAITYQRFRADVLTALTPHLPTVLLQKAFAAARAIGDEEYRAGALTALAPHFPTSKQATVLAEALAAARAIADEEDRARALRALVPHQPPTEQAAVCAEALAAACAIPDGGGRAVALTVLAPHLLPTEQAAVLAEALAAARASTNDRIRAVALTALAPHLLPTEQAAALAEALAAAHAITYERSRADALKALAPYLPPALLQEALAAACAITDEEYRADALTALAPHLPPTEQAAVLAKALAAARARTRDWDRADALSALAPHFPPSKQAAVLAEALAAAHAIADEEDRADALTALVPHLPPTEQTAICAAALAAARAIRLGPKRRAPRLVVRRLSHNSLQELRAIAEARFRAGVLTTLAPHLPPALLQEALADACAITHQRFRAGALRSLAPRLPPALFEESLAAVRAITDEEGRAGALAALVPHLPPTQQADVLAEALDAARAITHEEGRAGALAALVPHLPPTEQAAVLAEGLAAARAIADEENRADALSALAPHLPAALLQEALAAARAITDEEGRAGALAALVPHLPPTQQADVLAEALDAARAIPDGWDPLIALAPHLPPALLQEVLAAARARLLDARLARPLSALAPHLPPALLQEALADARTITHEEGRADALTALAPHLLPTEQAAVLAEALAAARAITNEEGRAGALAVLALHLAPADRGVVLTEALATVRAIVDKGIHTSTLRALALAHTSTPIDDDFFLTTLHICAQQGRSALLNDLMAITEWFIDVVKRAQQPEAPSVLAWTVVEVGWCWP